MKYRVLLPKTSFPLRADPISNDPSVRAAANFQGLYKWQLEHRDLSKTFVLHDGPPYANGPPHMGHALNKILKDFINRYKLLCGYRVHYRPGWDCHGLPIELKACREGAICSSPLQIRSKAAQFARSALAEQREAFQRWGCLGDWENPYLTMDKEYEAEQIGVFYEMYKRGCIYRGFRPVYWSPSSQTALAEAELEYQDHTSTSIYTLFPVMPQDGPLTRTGEEEGGGDGGGKIHALVWTTTPWTLLANRAICYHPEHVYSLIKPASTAAAGLSLSSCDLVLVGRKSLESLSHILGEFKHLGSFSGSELSDLVYTNPLDTHHSPPPLRPFLPGHHVSEEEGTGLVHMAPAHGHEDYSIGTQYKLDLQCLVDSEGKYLQEAGKEYAGLHVFDEGNAAILTKLKSVGALVSESPYTHRYPYDWRTKKPVLIRVTEQWFASVSSLKEKAKCLLQYDVTMYPSSAHKRILPMLESREDWCISRQRVWGVPLPIYYHKATNKPLISDETIDKIQDLIRQHGADCWWKLPLGELLPESLQSRAEEYVQGEDTMDVWFDSGTSWSSVLKDCRGGGGGVAEERGVADMYLEGSDQHRGWFQSSLLTSVAVHDRAPYRTVVTHGFVLDKTGDKMSKSLGNVTSPDDILSDKKLGGSADVMRLWVASSDYFRDIQLSDVVLRQSKDALQKMRNICRFLLGNLSDFDPDVDTLAYSDLSKLDRYILHILSEYNHAAHAAYKELNFSQLCHLVTSSFIPDDLSSFYFDVVKDCLYCDKQSGRKRRGVQTTLYHVLQTLVASIAPVVPHLAEEVAQHWPCKGD